LTFKYWAAVALILGLAWACDYTPELPPAPATTPRPSPAPGSSIPVIVVPISSPGPGPSPGQFPPAGSTFRIVMATPPEFGTINLPDHFAAVHRPILDFEFRYPQNLTLDDDFTNIEISLLSGTADANSECLRTDLGHSIRLDREDKVYLANSVALFRTGTWVGPTCSGRVHSSFTTSTVFFKLTPDVSRPAELWTFIPMEWTFVRP
jgi:hypothetical protein